MTEQNQKAEGKVKEIAKLSPGDYTIHVFLQKMKDVGIADGANETVVAMIQSDQSKEFSKDYPNQSNTSETKMGDHIFIEKRNQSIDDLQNLKVKVSLFVKGMLKNALIGTYEFDFQYIYFMANHAMQHMWVALSNPNSEDYSSVSGFVKISVSIHGAQDTPVLLAEDTNDSENVIMPSAIKPQFKQLKLHFFMGEKLPKMDRAQEFLGKQVKEGKMDAYFTTEINGKRLKTSIITTQGDRADWNETLLIPVRMPLITTNLILKLYDQDDSGDEICGSLILNYKELLERQSGEIFWLNIFGPPGGDEQSFLSAAVAGIGGRSKEYNDMCHNPKIASSWKCRVLIGVEHEMSEQPRLCVDKIEDDSLLQRAKKFMTPQPFQYQFLAGNVISTPDDAQDYYLELAIAEHTWKTKKGHIGRNFNRWNEFSNQTELMLPYADIEDIGTIFIYLCNSKGERLSYAKFSANEFTDPNPKLLWIEFVPDPVNKTITSPEKGGLCSFRLSIHKGDKSSINFSAQSEWKKKPGRRQDVNQVRAFVYQARELPAADEDGASDPILRFFNHWETNETKRKTAVQTRCVEDTCYPMYYQCLELSILGKADELPPFVIDVYDFDKTFIGGEKLDYMCRSIIPVQDAAFQILQDAAQDTGKPPDPKWHKCYFKQGQKSCGEILVSFVMVSVDEFDWKIPLPNLRMMGILNTPSQDAIVQFDEFSIEINVLGLRSLQSSGLLQVKKAYINFGLKTLVPPIEGVAIEDVQTTPGPSGPDPTINTVVSFQMILPNEHKYSPSMACRVYDKIFTGFEGQLIGVFTIPVGDIMHKQRMHNIQNLAKLQSIVDQLKEFLDEKAIPQYTAHTQKDPTQDAQLKSLVQSNKAQVSKVFAEDKRTPKTAQETLDQQRKQNLKKPLIQATDEDSDEDGNQLVRPVGIDAKTKPYEAPKLRLDAKFFDDDPQIDELKKTPRSQLTPTQRQQVDQALLGDVIDREVSKAINTLPKDADPSDPTIVKPIASPRVSFNELDKALKEHYGVQQQTGLSINLLDKVKGGINQQINTAIQRQVSMNLRIEQKEQQIAHEKLKAEGGSRAQKIIIEPEYALDPRLNVYVETNQPPSTLFEAIGWDRIHNETKEKHYRKYFTEELENVKEIMSTPSDFDQYKLMKGQVRGASSGMLGGLFSKAKTDESGEVDTSVSVGLFKGLISVTKKSEAHKNKHKVNHLLRQIYSLLDQIHRKMYFKELPFKQGVFGETHNFSTNFIEDAAHSSDCNSGPEESKGKQTQESKLHKKKEASDITIMNAEGRIKFRNKMIEMGLGHLMIAKHAMSVQSDEIMKRMLLSEKRCIVRTYIIGAFNLAQRDNDSPSDPYIVLKLGDKVFNDRDNYILDEPNPQIFKKIDFEAVFPGCPQLKIAFWDYDLLFGDDLIGETVIDLEDRYFSADWNVFVNKPIEWRKLYHPSSKMDQGTVRMWLEILPTSTDTRTVKEWDITNKPAEDFEVRVVVFETEELKMMDVEGTTDGFVKTFFDPQNCKETDTHFRNQDGHCSWNYRMLHHFKHPNKNYDLTVQAYDRDLFTANELIGDAVLNLKPLIEDASLTKAGVSLNSRYYEEYLKKKFPNYADLTFSSDGNSFWVNLAAKEKGKVVFNGKLRLQIDVLPKVEADKNRVGEAQSEPNVNPYLPKPEGRMQLSLNPFDMIQQLLGPQFRRMGYTIILSILCIGLCVMMLPMVLSEMFTSVIMSIF